jgi:hypothetical protein
VNNEMQAFVVKDLRAARRKFCLDFFICSWDKAYEDELGNFTSHGVVGDVWFGEDIMYKIVRWV